MSWIGWAVLSARHRWQAPVPDADRLGQGTSNALTFASDQPRLDPAPSAGPCSGISTVVISYLICSRTLSIFYQGHDECTPALLVLINGLPFAPCFYSGNPS